MFGIWLGGAGADRKFERWSKSERVEPPRSGRYVGSDETGVPKAEVPRLGVPYVEVPSPGVLGFVV